METGDLTHLLLYGPPGTGKTSTVLALCGGCEMLELNASDDRGIDTIRSQVKEFVSTRKLTAFFQTKSETKSASSSLKLVVLDECDALTLPAQMALRRIIEQYSLGARFCLIANHINKLIPAILSRCTRFRFSPLSDKYVADRVQEVANRENVPIHKDAVSAIVDIAAGDLRKAINTLQALHLATRPFAGKEETGTIHPAAVANGSAAGEAAPGPDGAATAADGGSAAGGTAQGAPVADAKGVGAARVYEVVGRCPPADLSKLFAILRTESYAAAYATMKKTVHVDGFSVADLVKGLHSLILTASNELDHTCFAKIIKDMADIERRVASGASEIIQLAALVATFQINRSPQKQ